jgi:RAT1-interacting protein
MTSAKRKISDLLNDEEYEATSSSSPSRPRTRPHLDLPPPVSKETQTETETLAYPRIPSDTPPKQTPFQQPTPLLSFSKTPDRTVEFTDSALRYFVDPPRGAQLGYGYERWVPKVEERGRVDGLVQALARVRVGGGVGVGGEGGDVGVVAWRGVITRYAWVS